MTKEQSQQIRKQLWELHSTLIEAILRRITFENPKASDFANAIQFLKDNGITKENIAEFEESIRQGWSKIDLPFPTEEPSPDDF